MKLQLLAIVIYAVLTRGLGEARLRKTQNEEQWNLNDVISALKKESFDVQNGKYSSGNAQEGYDQGKMPDANGNNANHPYNLAMVEPISEEPASSLSILSKPNHTLYHAAWRMRPDEAIVFVGRAPPKIDYFSFRSYLFYRFFPEESKIRKLFVSLGDTLNNVRTFKDLGPLEPFVFVSVASQTTLANVKKALNGVVPENRLFVDTIPLSLVKLCLEWDCDQVGILARFGNADEQSALEAYSLNPDGSSGTFLRATPREESIVSDYFPYTVIARDTPSNATTVEDPYESNLYMEGFESLRRGILKTWISKGFNPTEYQPRVWLTEGIDGLQRGVDLMGEDRDTSYIRSEAFTLTPGEVAVVYGVHHTNVNMSTYNSFAVYSEGIKSGVVGRNTKDPTFAGGANAYLDQVLDTQTNPDNYYVWHLTRDPATQKYYVHVPAHLQYKAQVNEPEDLGFAIMNRAEVIPVENEMFVGFRAYVNPATGVGPSWNEIIYDRVIKFTPSPVP